MAVNMHEKPGQKSSSIPVFLPFISFFSQNQVTKRGFFSDLLQLCLKSLCLLCFFFLNRPILSKIVRCGSVLLAIRHYVILPLTQLFLYLYVTYSDEWPEDTNRKEYVCIIRETTLRGCWISNSEITSNTLIRAVDCIVKNIP